MVWAGLERAVCCLQAGQEPPLHVQRCVRWAKTNRAKRRTRFQWACMWGLDGDLKRIRARDMLTKPPLYTGFHI